jgi:ribosomal protein S19E (S16A)
MLRVVFHESESVRKPDFHSEVQNKYQPERKKWPELEDHSYMRGAVVLAAIRLPQQV